MPDQVDEFGIPIKKPTQEVDEFGVPIKKKVGGTGGGVYASASAAPLPAIEIPTRKQKPFDLKPSQPKTVEKDGFSAVLQSQYTNDNGGENLFSLYENANYNQKQVMNKTGKNVPSEFISVNTGKPIAEKIKNPLKQEYDLYQKEKDGVVKELSPFIDKTINGMLESGEYKNFFVGDGILDEGKARNYFDKFTRERGGGQATRELLLSKFRGEAKNKLQQDDPAYQQILKTKMKDNGVDFNKYSQEYFKHLTEPYVKNANAITQEVQQSAEKYLNTLKPISNAATEEFNNYVGGLNEQVKQGAIPEQKAKELYGQKLDEYNKKLTIINSQYKVMVQKIQASANTKYLNLQRTIDKISNSVNSSEVFNNLPKAEQDKIKKTYADANNEYYKQKNNVTKAVEQYGNPLGNPISNIITKGLASGWNRGLAGIGNYLQKEGHDGGFTKWLMSKETDANVLAPAQYEWSKDEWYKRIASSTATSMGASAPILLPTLAAGYLTGGASVPEMVTGAIATGTVGYLGEKAQNTGDIYKQILEQTGDVNKATIEANKFEKKQIKTLPLYFVGGLGEVVLLKGTGVLKKLAGAGLEQIEEVPTEYMQSYDEAVSTQGYGKDIWSFVKENPEIGADTFFSTIGQSGAFAATGKMMNTLVGKTPNGGKQLFADMIQKEGYDFAIDVLKKYKQVGIIGDNDFKKGVIEVQKVNELLRSFDNMGISGNKAKALLTLNYQVEAIKQKIEQEKMPAVKIMYEQQLKAINDKIRNFNTEASYAVFTLPGGINSTMTVFQEDIDKMEQEGTLDDFVQKTDGITSNNPELNKKLTEIKKRVGNPKDAIDGAYIEPISEVVEPNNVDNSQHPQAASVENKPQPIRQLGTGANVYFETDKYRVNDYKNGKVLLNVGEENGLTPLANVEFDDVNEAVFVAKKLNENSPNGLVADYHNVDKIIANFKEEYNTQSGIKPTETTETIPEQVQNNTVPYEAFKEEMMSFAENQKDSSFEYRISIPEMSQKDREGAIKDIREGKNSKRAQRFEAAIKEMYDNGVVSVNRGRGNQSQFTDIKITEWFGLNSAEKAAVDEITDEEVSIINEEGITLDNLDTFKHLFNGFPYTEQDYEAVKSYLSAEGESNENVEPVSEEGSNETTETQQGNGVTPPPTEPTEEGFKSESGKKSLLGRAFEGESSESLKGKIAYYGLNYEVQTHDEARATAQQIIKELGLNAAVEAVRRNIVQDAEAAMIWAEAIDFIGEQIANETDPDTIAALEKEEASLLNEFDLRARGAGRFISSLNNIYNNSNFGYKLSERVNRYKNLNNGEIPAEVEAKYQELDKKYQELLKQIADMQEEQKKQREQQAMDNIKEETERATKREPKKTSTDKAKKIAEIIRKGKIQKPGIFMSSSPVSAIWDAAIEITAKAVEAGGRVSDAIIAGVEYIKQTDWYKNLNKDQQEEAVNSFAAGVNSTVNTEVKKPSINEDGKIIIPPSLIREYVEGGIDNINDLTEAIKQDLLGEYPDVTDRQVRDAITEYGKTINPTQDEVSQQISKMKNIGRIISALEDIEAKKRPLKSGLQRRKYDTEERALQKQLREALKELPADAEARDKQLKTTLEAIKTRLRNSIEDIEREIATGEKRATNKGEVAYDEEAKSLREERDRLREIRDEIFGDEVTEEQRISRALNVTERSIEQLEQKIKDNDLSFKQKQTLDSPELKAARERLKKLRDTINEMREQAGVAEASRLEAAKKRIEKRIAELKTRLANKDFTKKPKRVLAADEALIKLNAEKLFVQEEYAKEEYKAELKNRNLAQKIKDGATEIWGLTRVFMATGEFSFIGIQLGLYSLSHPQNAVRAFGKMLSHMTSEKRFNEWERYIKSQPYYPALKASKLALSEYDSKLTAREELGVSGWANHIWDYAWSPVKLVSNKGYEFLKRINPLKGIERAGVAYANHMRVQRFLTGMEKLQLEGKTFTTNPDDYKRMADVVNTLSGRASLGKLEPNAQTLALLFFSPRNWASMIKQFPPIFFTRQMYKWRGSDGKISVAQKMAVSDYMKFVTITAGSLLALAAYFNSDDDDDTEVSFDPTSSDFLKIRNKNTRIDVFGGRTQLMVFTMRMIFDEKTSISGKTSRLGEGMLAPNKRDLIIDMVSNKLAPTAGILNEYVNTRVKKNADGSYTRINKYTGEEYSILTKAAESVQPIFWGTVREIHKDQPAEVAAFLDVMAAIGVNIATYIPKKKKQSADGIIRRGE